MIETHHYVGVWTIRVKEGNCSWLMKLPDLGVNLPIKMVYDPADIYNVQHKPIQKFVWSV